MQTYPVLGGGEGGGQNRLFAVMHVAQSLQSKFLDLLLLSVMLDVGVGKCVCVYFSQTPTDFAAAWAMCGLCTAKPSLLHGRPAMTLCRQALCHAGCTG